MIVFIVMIVMIIIYPPYPAPFSIEKYFIKEDLNLQYQNSNWLGRFSTLQYLTDIFYSNKLDTTFI